jgi:Transposase IS4
MPHYRYTQIKRYFYVTVPVPADQNQAWYQKLSPLYEHLNTLFKAFYVPSQNVSVDEMMKAFTGQSAHTIKMPNKPIKEEYKM